MAEFVSPDRLSTFLTQVKNLLTGKVNTSDIAAKTKSELETIWTDSSVPNLLSEITEIESVNATKIENEISRAQTAEETLTTNLTAEIDRATAAEEANTSAISTNTENISTNATAISDLQTKVDGLFTVVSTW